MLSRFVTLIRKQKARPYKSQRACNLIPRYWKLHANFVCTTGERLLCSFLTYHDGQEKDATLFRICISTYPVYLLTFVCLCVCVCVPSLRELVRFLQKVVETSWFSLSLSFFFHLEKTSLYLRVGSSDLSSFFPIYSHICANTSMFEFSKRRATSREFSSNRREYSGIRDSSLPFSSWSCNERLLLY